MKSVRRQMILMIGVAALLLLVTCGFGLHFTISKALTDQLDGVLEMQAEALITAIEIEENGLEIDSDIQAFIGFGSRSPGDYFEIYDRDRELLQRSHSFDEDDPTLVDQIPPFTSGHRSIMLPNGVSGRAYWTTFTPTESADEKFEDLLVLVASERSNLDRTLRTMALSITLFGSSAVIVSLAILYFVVGTGLKPLERLSNDVHEIDIHRLSQRLSLQDLPVELRGVAGKLNELLERLEASFARERRFSSHAAHELRTPLAELRAMAELGMRWPDEMDESYATGMLESVVDLEQLIERLSLLARAESNVPDSLEKIDLETTVREALERLYEDIEVRKITLSTRIEEGHIRSDPTLWRAVVNNLLDNAITYSPEESHVEIEVTPKHLLVRNEAPELVSADVEHLFERFWRKQNSSFGRKHSGLGLSIVRSCVQHLGGQCQATLRDGHLQILITWT